MRRSYKGGGRQQQRQYPNYYNRQNTGRFDLQSALNGKRKIGIESEASDFFESIINSNSESILFDISSEKAKKAIKEASSLCSSERRVINSFVKFLDFLGRDEYNRGSQKEVVKEIYIEIYKTPGLISCLLARVQEKAIDDVTALVWFLVSVALCHDEARSNAGLRDICNCIGESNSCPAISELITVLAPSSQSRASFRSLDEVRALQPNHDNDFPSDYRKISIVPTASELNCPVPAELRYFDNQPGQFIESTMLERQFRLLREDMIAPIKDELKLELSMERSLRKKLFEDPILIDIECLKNPRLLTLKVEVTPPVGLRGRLRKYKNDHEKSDFLQNIAKRVLGRDSLVLFLDSNGVVLFVGSINWREPKEMVTKGDNLIVGITMLNRNLDDFLAMQHCRGDKNIKNRIPCATYLFQASLSFFSYRPVLERLLKMSKIPFKDQLAFQKVPSMINEELHIDRRALGGDRSQEDALRKALTQNVSLIQGPPGTGKTFLGVQVAKELIRMNNNIKILCLCYTNHALDSFLESLLDAGINKIARLGNSPKISERLQAHCINVTGGFDCNQRIRFARLSQEMETCESSIKEAKARVFSSRSLGRGAWKYINGMSYVLSDELQSQVDELHQANLIHAGLIENNEGFTFVGSNGTANSEDFLYTTWFEGKNFSDDPAVLARLKSDSIWKADKSQRYQIRMRWYEAFRKYETQDIAESIRRFSEVAELLKDLRAEPKSISMYTKNVIGCTTTTAATSLDLLRIVQPEVLIIEEAAEILEANVLTSIPDSVRQLVLIGDHLQLRPKLEYFPLRKESEQGIDFDVSVFERLVRQSRPFPFSTLTVQHRMRPEISALIRSTYPDLEDHPSVMNREHIRGIVSNVVFIDHKHLESDNEERALLGLGSKTNRFEADMVAKIVRYFLQQGYNKDDIVVLTPYLGQLMEIKNALRSINESVSISDMDMSDINRASLENNIDEGRHGETKSARSEERNTVSETANSKDQETENVENDSKREKIIFEKSKGIRVATVDNFQGEESKIIIGSLVRSNPDGDIGFVSGPERVNVFLSRARDGFIILGNRECLSDCRSKKGRAVWKKVFDALEAGNFIYNGFPAKCVVHGDVTVLRDPNDFDKMTPLGGCNKPCLQALTTCPLNHLCSRPCHPIIYGQDHLNLPCMTKVNDKCLNGHPAVRICSKLECEPCFEAVLDKCPQGHFHERKCSVKLITCSTCRTSNEKKKVTDEKIRQQTLKHAKKMEELENKRFEQQQKLMEMLSEQERELQQRLMEEELDHINAEMENLQTERLEVASFEIGEKNLSELPIPVNVKPKESLLQTTKLSQYKPGNHLTTSQNEAFAVDNIDSDIEIISKDVDNKPVDQDVDVMELSNHSTSIDPGAGATKIKSINDNLAPLKSNPPPVKSIARNELSRELNQWLTYCASEDWIKIYDSCNAYIQRNKTISVTLIGSNLLQQIAQLKLGTDPRSILLALESLKSKKVESTMEGFVVRLMMLFVSLVCKDSVDNLRHSAAADAKSLIDFYSTHNLVNIDNRGLKWILDEATAIYKKMEINTAKMQSNKQTRSLAAIWEGKKHESKTTNMTAIDELMQMTGLDSVKQSFLNQFDKIVISKEQRVPLSSSSYNARFDGNPGTGKTTVARLYARFLIEMNVLPDESLIEETSGSSLISSGGVTALKTILDKLKNVGGGVVFIDEAYQLNPQTDREGRQVLDFLLTHAEKLEGEYGKIAWIFAGYKKHMDTLFEHNPGLPSRFPIKFTFDDYTEEEMLSIFYSIMKRGGRTTDGKLKNPQNKAPKKPQNTSLSLPQKYTGYGYVSMNKQPEKDRWGNIWTWNNTYNFFEDEYNNMTGFGVSNIGTVQNPLVSTTDNTYWYYDESKGKWYSDISNGRRWSDYPGKPVKVTYEEAVPFKVTDERWVRIAIRRLSKGRGRVGFGNARAVRNLFDQTRQRQSARLSLQRSYGFNPDVMLFERSDLLGPKPDITTLESTKAWKELQTMEGLLEVKEEIRKLMNMVIQNAEREENEQTQLDISLNRVFLGNPGTGKTTVGKIYAQLLASLGLLSKGDCIIKNPSDFVGSVLGSSESNTRGILAQAEGSVLVIDEAYLLNPNMGSTTGSGSQDPYKSAVIDTIVEQVQGVPGDDRAVILLGYRKEMEALMAAANPGLSRRFQMENAFVFTDYDDNALIRILMKQCKKDGLEINVDVASHAVKKLAKARAAPNFGNAGSLNTLYSEAKKSLLNRQPKESRASYVLTASDFGPVDTPVSEDDLLSGLVGCNKVVSKLREYKSLIEMCKSKGEDPKKYVEYNFVFAGPPGTGKTTVARRMGTMFFSLGLLPCSDVIEISASDLITGYVGQAGKKTHDILIKARGKVLFIDEAYRMNPQQGGQYMQEVIDELVQQLTSIEFKQQLVVILAGYAEDMESLLSVNQGLRSRFSEKLEFSSFTASEVVNMFIGKIREANLCDLSAQVPARLTDYAKQLVSLPNFGNGRDVDTLSKRAIRNYAMRTASMKLFEDDMTLDDLDKAFKPFIDEISQREKEDQMINKVSAKSKIDNQKNDLQYAMLSDVFSKGNTNIATTVSKKASESDGELDGNIDGGNQADSNVLFNAEFQKILDEKGLNSFSGVMTLASYASESNEFNDLVQQLSLRTNLSFDEIKRLLIEWQHNTSDLEDKLKDVERRKEEAKAKKQKALLPIWKCAVCGAANKPFIACYVAPYVVGYDEFDLDSL